MVLPGFRSAIDSTRYCFVVNLGMHDTTIHLNVKLGMAPVGGGEVQMSTLGHPAHQPEKEKGCTGWKSRGVLLRQGPGSS